MLTKSPSVLRDLDLGARLTPVADAQIAFSVPTLDEAVWKKAEPGTARPSKRFEAMRRLVDAGVPCGVMMAPVIPGITDATESIEAVARAAADSGASFVAPNVLNLKPGTSSGLCRYCANPFRTSKASTSITTRALTPRRTHTRALSPASLKSSQWIKSTT